MRRTGIIIACLAAGLFLAPTAARADFLATFDSFPASATTEVESDVTVSGYQAVRPGHYSAARPLIFTVGGVKITVYREFNGTFDIIDNTLNSQVNKGVHPEEETVTNWGARSLDSFSDNRNAPFVINFEGADPPDLGDVAGDGSESSSPVGAASIAEDPTGLLYFSLIAGDYGFDTDFLQMEAWSDRDGTGERLGVVVPDDPLPSSDESTWTEQRFHFAVDDEETERIRSIRFFGGADDIDVFIDRFAGSLGTNLVPDTELIDGDFSEAIFDSNEQLIPVPATGALLGLAGLMMLTRRRRA